MIRQLVYPLLDTLGLVPRSRAIAGDPDRGAAPVTVPRPSVKKARPKPVARPKDEREVVSWGDGKLVRATVKRDLPDGAAYEFDLTVGTVEPVAAADVPWTLYDEQALAREQASTRGFTRDEYQELRMILLANRKITNGQVADLKGKSKSWAAKRMRAIRKAFELIDADLAAGKPLPPA